MLFDIPVVFYLFLGGTGAGAAVVLGCLEGGLPNSLLAYGERDSTRRAWIASAFCVLVGMACLLLDLGHVNRVLELLSSPRLTPVTIGAFSLVLTFAAGAALALLSWRWAWRKVCCILAIASGLFSLGYTGVLLSSLSSVAAWQTPLVPLMFSVSSLSCGCMLVITVSAITDTRDGERSMRRAVSRVDSALLLAELATLALYMGMLVCNPATNACATALLGGPLTPWFCIGLVGMGLVLPFALELVSLRCRKREVVLLAALLVLFGGFVLRWCIVALGAFDVTYLVQYNYGITLR